MTGVSPQFVFLQLYLGCHFGDPNQLAKPVLLPPSMETSIKNLDRIHA